MEKKDWKERLGYYEDGIYIDGKWEDSEEKLFKFIELELVKARGVGKIEIMDEIMSAIRKEREFLKSMLSKLKKEE